MARGVHEGGYSFFSVVENKAVSLFSVFWLKGVLFGVFGIFFSSPKLPFLGPRGPFAVFL